MLCNLFIELKTVLCVKCDYYVFYKHTTKYLVLLKEYFKFGGLALAAT